MTPKPTSLSSPGRARHFDRFTRMIARTDPRWFALVASSLIALLAVFGIIQRYFIVDWKWANLDSEAAVGKWIASGLLWIAAGCWFLVAVSGRARSRAVWVWWPALAWLAFDEGNVIHERLEKWSGLDWQLIYLPVIAVAGLAGLRVLLDHRNDLTTARVLVAGGVAWVIALLLELLQNWGGPPIDWTFYSPMMISEEIIEMIGSTLFVIAGLLVLRAPPASLEPDRGQREHLAEPH